MPGTDYGVCFESTSHALTFASGRLTGAEHGFQTNRPFLPGRIDPRAWDGSHCNRGFP